MTRILTFLGRVKLLLILLEQHSSLGLSLLESLLCSCQHTSDDLYQTTHTHMVVGGLIVAAASLVARTKLLYVQPG